ncbi:MAG: threonine ammonia-lyase [Sulfurovaceae bacterium]|nr:threonine ammonia-lyase [Sulfurovaceae bacterium]
MLNIDTIQGASKRLEAVVHLTPFAYAPNLSNLSNYEVYLKKENLQRTGSFKLRGAFNKIATLVEDGNIKGVVAASAGNHAQGVAFSASHFGLKATIVMPESTPLTKIQGVREFGAEVILHGVNYDEAYAYAIDYAKSNGASFVHPFADDDVMSGQGTIALEMLGNVSDLDAIIVPVGGGGLISGIAAAAKAINPKIKVIGVAAKGAPAMKQSFDAKRAMDTLHVRTIADGIAVRDTSPVTLEYILKSVDDIVLVREDEIANAILFLLEKQKILVEGAGAVGVAALMHGKLKLHKNSKVGIVVSGGNIDVTMLSLIIEKGLMKSARKMKLMVTLVDKPGALMKFTEILRSVGANIVHIGYDRTSIDLEFGDAHVSVALETKGETHQEEIREKLKQNGFVFSEAH